MTINLVVDEDGIFNNATNAVEKSNIATGAVASATKTVAVKSAGIKAADVAKDTSYIGKYVNYTVPSGGNPNVKWSDESYDTFIDGISTSKLENLYVINDYSKASDYWLASPSTANDDNYIHANYDINN